MSLDSGPKFKNPQEIEAEKVLALVDEVIGRGYEFDPEQYLRVLKQINENKKAFDQNSFLRKELAKRLTVFIDKVWRSENIVKADTVSRQAQFVDRLKEWQQAQPDGGYINNFRAAFTHTNHEYNSRMDVVLPKDFKELKLSEEQLAQLYWYGFVRTIQVENRPNFIMLSKNDQNLRQQGDELNKQATADMEKVMPLFKDIFDRLVVEYGYEPEKLAG